MDKLWLIIKREYITRVKKRSFILTTLLTPLAFAIFFLVIGLIFSYETDDKQSIAVIDKSDLLNKSFKDEKNLYFKFVDKELNVLKQEWEQNDYTGILVIPPMKEMLSTTHTVYLYADEQIGLDLSDRISDRIASKIRDFKIDRLELDRDALSRLKTKVNIDPEPIKDNAEDASTMTSIIASAIGGIMGIIMYMAMFIYGMMVMRSVMEEKMNRIVEVMISSVKPFQLMMGKILGVGAVGMTQLIIWAILIPLLNIGVSMIFPLDPSKLNAPGMSDMQIDPDDTAAMIGQVMAELSVMNWPLILGLFVLFFLGGYILYSAMFAAVGSAMSDDMGESQALTLPITIPVLIAFYIMIVAVRAPNSSLAVWSSIFPLFSPIVMPARLAFDPPWWQIALSLLCLFITCLFFVWLAGRIYRVGILMYGKKTGFKELAKWIFYKD